jgi:hypothetical protein
MPSFTLFRPTTNVGALYGGAIVVVSVLVAAALLYKGLTMEARLAQVGPFVGATFFAGIAALYGYWTWGCQSLSYVVDRNALSIRWGGIRQIIPILSIERLIPAAETESPSIEGVNWVGHHVGRAEIEELGDVLFYSTHRTMADVLYVQTPQQTYAISVPDPVFFAQTVQSNQSRGPLEEPRQVVERWGIASQTFWLDEQALLLAGLLIATFFVTFGYVLSIYPDLNDTVALRFPAFGGIARLSDREALLDIPRTAAGFLALNLVLAVALHGWERMVSYVLLLAGIALQVLLLVAAIVAVA